MAKLKLTLYDKIFRKDRFKEIFTLRAQVKYMIDSFESVDIWARIGKYRSIGDKLYRHIWLTFDEVGMYNNKGEKAVINRLMNDRNEIYNLLKDVPEIDLSDIGKSIRDKKLTKILNDDV